VLRHLTIKTKAAVTAPSAMMKEEKSRSFGSDAAAPAPAAAAPAAAA
jgi:small subunit ribosomal protein S6